MVMTVMMLPTLSIMLLTGQVVVQVNGFSLRKTGFSPYKGVPGPGRLYQGSLPAYSIVQLSPADLQSLEEALHHQDQPADLQSLEEALHQQDQARDLQEQVWLAPGLRSAHIPSDYQINDYVVDEDDDDDEDDDENDDNYVENDDPYDLQRLPVPFSLGLHKKDLEKLQYPPPQDNLPENPKISFRKTPAMPVSRPPKTSVPVFTAERRGMKEEPIFRPEPAGPMLPRGRKKRSIPPPFIRNEKIIEK